jgi:uncharacterized metal-binding protein
VNKLTDNKKANLYFFIPLVFVWVTLLLQGVALPAADEAGGGLAGGLLYLSFFCCGYLFSSVWFSPDLDIRSDNKPGKYSFPLSFVIKPLNAILPANIKGPLLAPIIAIHEVMNFAWRLYWKPFGYLFTHRGVIHWPVAGTILKISYVYFSVFIFVWLLQLPSISSELKAVYLFVQNIPSLIPTLEANDAPVGVFLGIVIGDLVHIAVDWRDTVRNNRASFVPPPAVAPRGVFYKIITFFRR